MKRRRKSKGDEVFSPHEGESREGRLAALRLAHSPIGDARSTRKIGEGPCLPSNGQPSLLSRDLPHLSKSL